MQTSPPRPSPTPSPSPPLSPRPPPPHTPFRALYILAWPATVQVSYYTTGRFFLVLFGTAAFCTLTAGMWLFTIASPYFFWFGGPTVFLMVYLICHCELATPFPLFSPLYFPSDAAVERTMFSSDITEIRHPSLHFFFLPLVLMRLSANHFPIPLLHTFFFQL